MGFLKQDAPVVDYEEWSKGTRAEKIARDKPSEAVDFCYLSSDPTFSTKVFDKAACDADPLLKPAASPRQVAGGPLTEDILKCQLKPLNQADYAPLVPTAAQWARLQAAFPGGVCDWSQAGVGQQASMAPETFAAGPGGKPLGPAPMSQSSQ